MLHGEPTWSYLYRHVVDAVVEAGLRAVAVDMVGFGRSDKPAAIADHSYARHVAWTRRGRRGARPARRRAARPGLGRADRAAPRRRRARPLRRRRRLEHRPADRRHRHAGGLVAVPRRPSRRRRSSTSAASSRPAACAGSPTPTAPRTTPRSPTRRSRRGRGRCRCSCRPARTTRRPSATAPRGRRWAATRSRSSSRSPTPTRSPAAMGPVLRRHVPGAAGREHPTIADAGHFLQEDAGAELRSCRRRVRAAALSRTSLRAHARAADRAPPARRRPADDPARRDHRPGDLPRRGAGADRDGRLRGDAPRPDAARGDRGRR